MKHILTLALTALLLVPKFVARAADELVVYPPVPGLAASEHYKVRVRSASEGSEWQSAFAWETVCKTIEMKTDAYFDTLAGWTHTYVNFETAGAVEIEIARVNGQPIRAAAVHPQRKASACSVKDGKVLVRLDTKRGDGHHIRLFGLGTLSGVLFQNISIAAPSVLGVPQILWGQADARIRNLVFENLMLAGKPVRDSAFFKTNEFVNGLTFSAGAISKP